MVQLSPDASHTLVIALGDPAGIGIEVVLKALAHSNDLPTDLKPVLVGCRRCVELTHQHLLAKGCTALADPAELTIHDHPLARPIAPGEASRSSGEAGFQWLTSAVDYLQSTGARALVTAPIAKHLWHEAGHDYPGQTERLAELAGNTASSMLFTALSPQSGWRLNTLLATTHIPLSEVPRRLNPTLVEQKLDTLFNFCRRFRANPHLVIAGLNPHAGEAGRLGREELDWLIPLMESWRVRHPESRLDGPIPPDTCWMAAADAWRGTGVNAPDGWLALYHDQGLIPVKLLAFDAAVNTTLELPFLRTSPDHGTGFDIAGSGQARPDSMLAAIQAAWDLSLDRIRPA